MNRKEILSDKIELILRDMLKEYTEWRNNCGTAGWYTMNEEYVRQFFRKNILKTVIATAEVYDLYKKEPTE